MTLSLSVQTEPGVVAAGPTASAPALPFCHSVGRVEFSLALKKNDAEIRGFIAGQSMGGSARIEMRTEPSFHAAVALLGDDPHILLARDRSSCRVVGLGVRTSRQLLLNGRAQNRWPSFIPSRGAPEFRGRRDFLRAGYGMLRELQNTHPVDFSLTAILSENHAARRLLEARLPGLPIYKSVTDVLTFTIPTVASAFCRCAMDDPTSLTTFLSQRICPMPLAPVIDESLFENSGTPHPLPEDFVTVSEGSQINAAAAIWDQRSIRQTFITGYHGPLRRLRPIYNALQAIRSRPRLPAPGLFNHAFISHLAVDPQRPQHFKNLLKALAQAARARGIDFLTLSLAASHPLSAIASKAAFHTLRSTLYGVHWRDQHAPEIPSATPYVEAAHL